MQEPPINSYIPMLKRLYFSVLILLIVIFLIFATNRVTNTYRQNRNLLALNAAIHVLETDDLTNDLEPTLSSANSNLEATKAAGLKWNEQLEKLDSTQRNAYEEFARRVADLNSLREIATRGYLGTSSEDAPMRLTLYTRKVIKLSGFDYDQPFHPMIAPYEELFDFAAVIALFIAVRYWGAWIIFGRSRSGS